MKVGLDFHGVIDKQPELFAKLSNKLRMSDCEIHIITGHKITDEFVQQLKDWKIRYTHLFSIVDYHESINTFVQYDERGPWIDEELWNKTKSIYCEEKQIDVHIDDSEIYGKYFTGKTIYLLMNQFENKGL